MRYLVILAILMAAGCGQKGALFLPENTPKEIPKQPTEQTADVMPDSGDVSEK